MDYEDYKKAINMARREFNKTIRAINITYAMCNNTVLIGDVVRNNREAILVDKIDWGFRFGGESPECIYSGVRLTKSGKPFKTGERAVIYKSNILEDK